jgi:hypothetical protein
MFVSCFDKWSKKSTLSPRVRIIYSVIDVFLLNGRILTILQYFIDPLFEANAPLHHLLQKVIARTWQTRSKVFFSISSVFSFDRKCGYVHGINEYFMGHSRFHFLNYMKLPSLMMTCHMDVAQSPLSAVI